MAGSRYASEKSLEKNIGYEIIKRIFTEKNSEGRDFQDYFNYNLSKATAEELLQTWLLEFGADEESAEKISELANSDEIGELLQKNVNIIRNEIHAKGIPTMIYDGGKHTGKFEAVFIF